jgi:hypothetical protein
MRGALAWTAAIVVHEDGTLKLVRDFSDQFRGGVL